MVYTRILILSALEEEVSEWLNAVPSQGPFYPDNPIVDKKDPTRHARGYYRKVINQHELIFDIFGMAGDLKKFDWMLEVTLEGLMGIIFLVDQRKTESYEDSKAFLA